MIYNHIFSGVVVANALWFGAGFYQFTLRSGVAALGVSTNSPNDDFSRSVIAGVLRFLGGLNLSLAALSVMLLLGPHELRKAVPEAVFLTTFAIAHASQFAVNVPIARKEIIGSPALWPVLRGKMLAIFVVDLLLTLIDATLVIVIENAK